MKNRFLQSVIIAIALAGTVGSPCVAQLNKAVTEIDAADVEEHLDDFIPLSAVFTDDRGRRIRLQNLFTDDRPVILSMNYSSCPMLCSTQMNGLVDGLKQVDLLPGTDFEIVSVSIDPLETTATARDTQQKYAKLYGRPGSGRGWHFLTGEQQEITRLAESIGFKYQYIPKQKEYSHPAVFVICTPDGRISRYLYGVQFQPQTLRLSLVEAADGKIGTTMDRVILTCFAYDATAGNYSPTVIGLMKVGAGATVMGLILFLLPAWLRKRPSKTNTDSESTALNAV